MGPGLVCLTSGEKDGLWDRAIFDGYRIKPYKAMLG